jgi:hypothetical protein
LRHEHPALQAGRLWHLSSDDASYVFLREAEEERVIIAFNNSMDARALKILLRDTPAKDAAGFSQVFGQAQADVKGGEVHISMPAQSISIFVLD